MNRRYPTPAELQTIYDANDATVAGLAGQVSIGPEDLANATRHVRVRVAGELWAKCDALARALLLADPHPHVRSNALLADAHAGAPYNPTLPATVRHLLALASAAFDAGTRRPTALLTANLQQIAKIAHRELSGPLRQAIGDALNQNVCGVVAAENIIQAIERHAPAMAPV
ncbi:hypothetical protein ACU4GI_32700 [Cupriavidus basilensis]